MSQLFVVFVTGFLSVFALGFNSRNVNNGDYGWAAATSMFIGMSQALLWRHITADDSVWTAIVYSVSGMFAITSSMYVHERFIKNAKRNR